MYQASKSDFCSEKAIWKIIAQHNYACRSYHAATLTTASIVMQMFVAVVHM